MLRNRYMLLKEGAGQLPGRVPAQGFRADFVFFIKKLSSVGLEPGPERVEGCDLTATLGATYT